MNKHTEHNTERPNEGNLIHSNKEHDLISNEEMADPIVSQEPIAAASEYISSRSQGEEVEHTDPIHTVDSSESADSLIQMSEAAMTDEEEARDPLINEVREEPVTQEAPTADDPILSQHAEKTASHSIGDAHSSSSHEDTIEDTFDYQKFHEKLYQLVGDPDQTFPNLSEKNAEERMSRKEEIFQEEEDSSYEDAKANEIASMDDNVSETARWKRKTSCTKRNQRKRRYLYPMIRSLSQSLPYYPIHIGIMAYLLCYL